MCCLKNEEETYEELNRKLPNPGDRVTTPEGLKGEVQSVNAVSYTHLDVYKRQEGAFQKHASNGNCNSVCYCIRSDMVDLQRGDCSS